MEAMEEGPLRPRRLFAPEFKAKVVLLSANEATNLILMNVNTRILQ
jgi:hypothetical protein